MNDQAKKLRELAQRIREEREHANLIIDPIKILEESSLEQSIGPKIKEAIIRWEPKSAETPEHTNNAPSAISPTILEPKTEDIEEKMESAEPIPSPIAGSSPKSFSTRVIAISSGKGGVGKSNLTANLGIALAMRGKKVMVLDADLGLANIDVLFGINPKYNLKHLMDGEKTISEILVEGPHSLRLVPGGSGIPEMANLSDENQLKLIESFIEIEHEADITLIDTGAGISKDIISFILAAREALIITTPEPTAITDAYGLIKVLTQRDEDVDIKIVTNMVSGEREGLEIANRIIMATRQFLNKRVESIGYIVSDPTVNMSVRKQEPFIIGHPNTRASKCVMQIASNLDSNGENSSQVALRNGFRGFLSRLFER